MKREKGRRSRSVRKRFGRALAIFLALTLITGFGAAVYSFYASLPGNIVMHIHSRLIITTQGVDENGAIVSPENLTLPSDIGAPGSGNWRGHELDAYGVGGFAPLHTHREDNLRGVIHVESNTERDFTLGDFFKVWGPPFSSTCLLSICPKEPQDRLEMKVNGEARFEFENLVLREGDIIWITFTRVPPA